MKETSEFWQLLMHRDVPTWVAVTAATAIVVAWVLDRLAGAAARIAGITHEKQARTIVEVETRNLRLIKELDEARHRADHEARSREAADNRLRQALSDHEDMYRQLQDMRKRAGYTTGERPALPRIDEE